MLWDKANPAGLYLTEEIYSSTQVNYPTCQKEFHPHQANLHSVHLSTSSSHTVYQLADWSNSNTSVHGTMWTATVVASTRIEELVANSLGQLETPDQSTHTAHQRASRFPITGAVNLPYISGFYSNRQGSHILQSEKVTLSEAIHTPKLHQSLRSATIICGNSKHPVQAVIPIQLTRPLSSCWSLPLNNSSYNANYLPTVRQDTVSRKRTNTNCKNRTQKVHTVSLLMSAFRMSLASLAAVPNSWPSV